MEKCSNFSIFDSTLKGLLFEYGRLSLALFALTSVCLYSIHYVYIIQAV